jgi:uncharacterized protein YgbK (DUF1537 family)
MVRQPDMHRSLIDLLPTPAGTHDFSVVRRHVSTCSTKTVVLDDDPTGTQTVHGVDVLAEWSVPLLSAALSDARPCFYVLTNTRSMSADEASRVVREVTANLAEASRRVCVGFGVVSRGDSTLRGHFAEELDAIEKGLGTTFDATIVIPAFFEGGRYTVDDVHYVADGENLVPAAETEFSRDRTFGYSHSNLREWIEEKTGGAVPAASVASIAIGTLRGPAGADAVRQRLLSLPKGSFVVVNAAAYPDLEVFTHGLLEAENAGRRYLLRTAASFVRVRSGIEPRPFLGAAGMVDRGQRSGLVVVGSYVRRTSVQLESLLGLPCVSGIEIAVDRLADDATRTVEIARAGAEASAAMRSGRHAVIFTSRKLESALGAAGELTVGRSVSEALVDIVRAIPERPRFLVAKGGITSCDIAIRGLGMRKALVIGQTCAGVPVWELGPETQFPGLKLVVWPGNVGGPDALRDLVRDA